MKYIVLLLVAVGCTTLKKGLVQQGDINEAIENAILDFSRTTSIYKKGRVFSISVYENNDKNQFIVRVGTSSTKLLLTKSTLGSRGEKFPSRFVKRDDKLFYWWDKNFAVSKETIAMFKKYDLLQDDEGGVITIPDFVINDKSKAAHYYFCKTDLSIYKKVITDKGIGYYKPPSLSCK